MIKRNGGGWTEARYRTFVRSALRAAFRKWPPRYQALKAAATTRKVNAKTGRLAMHYVCAGCKQEFAGSSVHVDHKKPVVLKNFVSWDVFVNRLFCEASNLQILCHDCHKTKTSKERKNRAKK